MAQLEQTKVQKSYPHGECPDCFQVVPGTAKHGDSCKNCGHVFWIEE